MGFAPPDILNVRLESLTYENVRLESLTYENVRLESLTYAGSARLESLTYVGPPIVTRDSGAIAAGTGIRAAAVSR